jgi:hypothetical protein
MYTAPPTNQSAFNEWTVGSVFYSAMIMAEAFGKQESRIVDLQVGSPLTPAYAIYEGNTLSKFALFNYVDDRSGACISPTTLPVSPLCSLARERRGEGYRCLLQFF